MHARGFFPDVSPGTDWRGGEGEGVSSVGEDEEGARLWDLRRTSETVPASAMF